MTAQIFVDILNHGFQSVNKINLIIFDECHAATKDAPMRQVFLKLDQFESKIFLVTFSRYSLLSYNLFFKHLNVQEFWVLQLPYSEKE